MNNKEREGTYCFFVVVVVEPFSDKGLKWSDLFLQEGAVIQKQGVGNWSKGGPLRNSFIGWKM